MPTFTGDAGNNTLTGAAGDDVLEGLGGDDILIGGDGADVLDGGQGSDTASYATASAGVTVDLNVQGSAQDTVGAGADTLISIENLTGSAFNDSLTGDGGANRLTDHAGMTDILRGMGGDDILTATRVGTVGDTFLRNVTLDGGEGNDVLSFSAVDLPSSQITILGGAGNDDVTVSGAQVSNISLGDGDDVARVDTSRGNYNINLGTGSDRVVLTGTPTAGRVYLDGFTAGDGGDVIDLSTFLTSANLTNYTPGANPFTTGHLKTESTGMGYTALLFSRDGGASGYVTLISFNGTDGTRFTAHNFGGLRPFASVINGNANANTIEGSDNGDAINGLGANDTLVGRGGDDSLDGGAGDDMLFGDFVAADARVNGADILIGGQGQDILVGGGGDDVLSGGDGNDTLYTGRVHSFTGSPPVVNFIPQFDHSSDGGFDVVNGGSGADIAYLMYSTATASIVLDNSNLLGLNAVTLGGVVRGSVTGVETLFVYGGSAGDTLTAGAYADTLIGNGGDDVLSGGAGDDVLNGGAGADHLNGGAGRDIADYSTATSGVTIDLANQGVVIGSGGAAGDILTGIEGLTGSAFSDLLRGNADANVITDILGGSDVVEGLGGDDVLTVGRAETADILRVDGGDGNDTITVNPTETVEIFGGAGDDAIHTQTYHSTTISLGSGSDLLVLSGVAKTLNSTAIVVTDFQAGPGGDILDVSAWFPGGASNPFANNNLRLVQSGADTVLEYNNGSWTPVVILRNTQVSAFGPQNFHGYAPAPATDPVVGVLDDEQIQGTDGADTVQSLGGADGIRGAGGNDLLVGNSNSLTRNGSGIDGGAGDDTIRGSTQNDALTGGAGSDIIFGAAGADVISGGGSGFTTTSQQTSTGGVLRTTFTHTLADPQFDDGAADVLYGDAGDDTIYAGVGDTAHGGLGTDRLIRNLGDLRTGLNLDLRVNANSQLSAAAGVTFTGFETFTLIGTASNDIVLTGEGTDNIDGAAGDDVLTGGSGSNTLTGGRGADRLDGGGGADVLISGEYGSGPFVQRPDGRWVISYSIDDGAADVLNGGDGVDTIYMNYGDSADGGEGSDSLYLSLSGRGSGVNLDLTTDTQAALAAVTGGTLTGFESFTALILTEYDDVVRAPNTGNLYGGGGNDRIYGSETVQFMGGDDGDDWLEGLGGNDRLWGGAGDDVLLGGDGADMLEGDGSNDGRLNLPGSGNDILNGGLGNDTIDGGAGIDTAVFSGPRSAYTLSNRGGGVLSVVGPDGGDLLFDIERLRFDDGLFDLAGNLLPNEVNGTPNADTLNGTAAADLIAAGDGDDLITGGLGNDLIDGGAGFDTAVFSAGLTTVTVNNGVVTVTGPDGVDTLTNVERLRFGTLDLAVAGLTGTTVIGTAAGETLTGGTGDDRFFGLAGNDVFTGGSGSDTADYSQAAGAVTARIDTQSASNDGDGGSDTFTSIENLTGSAFNDLLVGDGAANILSGGLGRDVIIAGGGNDTIRGGAGVPNELYGGAGDDTYIVEERTDSIVELANEGVDTVLSALFQINLSANVENLTYTGTGTFTGVGNAIGNVITGGSQRDVLLGLGGDDILIGGAGAANELYGGAGNDTYVLDVGDSIIEGVGDGVDLVQLRGLHAYNLGGNVENGTVVGTGDYVLNGNGLDNVLTGGAGNDTLQGGAGNDTMHGGDGIDTVTYILSTAGVNARLDVNRGINDGLGGADTFTGVENLTGSNLADLLIGNAGDNVIDGAIGNDVILGFDGNDTLIGGSGGGFNEMYGGRGDDLYIVDAGDTLIELAGEGVDTVRTTNGGYTLAANIENLTYAGPGDFAGTGNAGANIITGSNGHDTLNGRGGDDTLVGGGGNDLALLSGVRADYVITAIDGGWRVVDGVAGRDGTDTLLGVESVRFANGEVLLLSALTPAVAAPAAEVMPLVSTGKADADAFVLPALADKGGDGALVLPSLGEAPWGGLASAGFKGDLATGFLPTDPDGLYAPTHPFAHLADPLASLGHDWTL